MKHLGYCLLLLVFFSCNREYFSGRTNYVYENISDHHIELLDYVDGGLLEAYILEQNDSFELSAGPGRGNNNGPLYVTPFEFADSIQIIFDDTILIRFNYGIEEGNPMRIENYNLVEGEKEPYILLFEFTNEDYQRALDRGRIINN